MKTSLLFALSFAAAVGDAGAQTCTGGTCPEVVVSASRPVPSFQFGVGSWGRIGGGISWDNSPSDSGGGGGMSPMPTDPDSGRDGVCALFAFRGFPEGCTRQSAAQTAPTLSRDDFAQDFGWLAYSTNVPQPIVQEWSDLRNFFNEDFSGISGYLANCYADPTRDVTSCEQELIGNLDNEMNAALADFPWMIPAAQYQYRGLHRLFTDVSNERWWANLFGNDLGVGIGPFELSVNGFQNFIMSSRFNDFILARRRHDNCSRLMQIYDQNNCAAG